MEETIALISFYTKRKDFHHLHKYNSRFHSQIARASGNIWLLDIMDRLLSYTSVFENMLFPVQTAWMLPAKSMPPFSRQSATVTRKKVPG